MKVSIDSSEPLEEVLRVVGALYDVHLVTGSRETDNSQALEAAPVRRASVRTNGRVAKRAKGPSAGNRRGRGSRSTRPGASNEELRSWARQNGHTVSDRGRVPASVVTAYQEAAHAM